MSETAQFLGPVGPAQPADDDLAALRALVEGTARTVGREFFHSLVRHLADAVSTRYAFVAEFVSPTRARTVAFWFRDRIIENVEWDLAGTPCEEVVRGNLCHYSIGVKDRFPSDKALVDWGIESYLGVPLYDAQGKHLGHLAVFNEGTMPEEPRRLYTFRIFAARAAAELERLRYERKLIESEERSRKLYEDRLQAEKEQSRLQQQNLYLQEEIQAAHNFEEIIGQSPALSAVLNDVSRVAATDSTVLITGETGTGKELIARAIHSASKRKDKPLIKINCAALPDGLIESELFGHEKGAFTGAIARRAGRFELAHGGTVFLDEIGELPAPAQAKLLRVLQEREFDRVGGNQPIKVDVRVIAATNRDLQQAARDKTFREDLFYRLNVFPIRLPALCERAGDIPLLVHFLVGNFATRLGKKIDGVSRDTMERLVAYSWPGNVRELENVLERAVILAAGPLIEIEPEVLPIFEGESTGDGEARLDVIQRNHIQSILGQTNWVIEGPSGAARVLGLHPNTLRSRMKKLGLVRSAHDRS